MSKKQIKDQQMHEELVAEFQEKYGVSREEVDAAIRLLGHIRSRLHAYFLVQAHEQKKLR